MPKMAPLFPGVPNRPAKIMCLNGLGNHKTGAVSTHKIQRQMPIRRQRAEFSIPYGRIPFPGGEMAAEPKK